MTDILLIMNRFVRTTLSLRDVSYIHHLLLNSVPYRAIPLSESFPTSLGLRDGVYSMAPVQSEPLAAGTLIGKGMILSRRRYRTGLFGTLPDSFGKKRS